MGSIDDVTWQVLTVALTVAGLVTTGLLWRLRGAASGLRALAWSLLPPAAYFTGTLRLLWEVTDAVVSWAVRFVFSPVVWLGIAIAGVSAVLFVVAGQMRRRGIGTKGRTREVTGAARSEVSLPGREAAPERRGKQPADDDLADIEAILRKHGIS